MTVKPSIMQQDVSVHNIISLVIWLCIAVMSIAGSAANATHVPHAFLVLADVHFDPFVACRGPIPCPLIQQLRQANVADWPTLLQRYDTAVPTYQHDTTYPLLVATLQEIHTLAHAWQIDFVLLLGDLLGHQYKQHYVRFTADGSDTGYQAFVDKTMLFLVHEFNAALPPNTNIYPAVGNNDTYQEHYVLEPDGRFFQNTANIWAALLKDSMSKQQLIKDFSHAGYYAVTLPQQNKLRLIVLNTVLFSAKAKGKHIAETAAQELAWLEQRLQDIVAQQQKAIIVMHIPPAIDIFHLLTPAHTPIEFYQTAYTQRLVALLTAFKSVIVGIYHAHLHTDWFQLFTHQSQQLPQLSLLWRNTAHSFPAVAFGIPAISPLLGNNPAVKVFTYHRNSSMLPINYYTYIYPLVEKTPTWQEEYNFNAIYQPNCHDTCQLIPAILHWYQAPQAMQHYQQYFSAASQPPLSSYLPYWCQIYYTNVETYQACLQSSTVYTR